MYSSRWATSCRGVGSFPLGGSFRSRRRKRLSHASTQSVQTCASSCRNPRCTKALPATIGPASAVVLPQKSQYVGAGPEAWLPSFLAVKAVTPLGTDSVEEIVAVRSLNTILQRRVAEIGWEGEAPSEPA